MSLKEAIKAAEARGVAIGHFNFAESTVAEAGAEAALELGVPVILGTSEGEREFIGVEQAAALVKSLGVFINADHTKSLNRIKEVVAVGYDAVLFDGSELPLEENIKSTREVVEWVKAARPEVLVEGEIGYIGSSSKVHEAIPEGIQLTSVEDAVRFVKETGVDLLAPAVGNVHGIIMRTNADGTRIYAEPALNIERIRAIKQAVKIPLVLHGASGNSDEDIRAAIKAGISIVHINTEIRVAWQKALHEAFHQSPGEIAPYKIMAAAKEAAKKVIVDKLKLFIVL